MVIRTLDSFFGPPCMSYVCVCLSSNLSACLLDLLKTALVTSTGSLTQPRYDAPAIIGMIHQHCYQSSLIFIKNDVIHNFWWCCVLMISWSCVIQMSLAKFSSWLWLNWLIFVQKLKWGYMDILTCIQDWVCINFEWPGRAYSGRNSCTITGNDYFLYSSVHLAQMC